MRPSTFAKSIRRGTILAKAFAKAGNLDALKDYWSKRFGSGHAGDFDECVQTLTGKEGIDDPNALCAWLHRESTGYMPGKAPSELKDK